MKILQDSGTMTSTATYLLFLVVCLVPCVQVCGKILTIQTDFQRNRDNHQIWDLSHASNGKALIMKADSTVSINFCLREISNVSIVDFRFANANASEIVLVDIDGTLMGLFETPITMGDDWNSFLSTGRFPRTLYNLPLGWHNVYIKFNGTADGIAVDKIDLDVSDNLISQDIFTCKLTCVPHQKFQFRPNNFLTSASLIVQESYKTSCPEVDNINIPIFNPSVLEYEITAALPAYRSFSNWRHENTTGCPHLSPILWSFDNIQISKGHREAISSEKATLTFSRGRASSSKLALTVTSMFMLEGKSSGMQDSDIGSLLRIRFDGLTSNVKMTMYYRGKAVDMSAPAEQTVTPENPHATWNIKDFTWAEGYYNFIVLRIETNSSIPLNVNSLLMERRPMLPDQVSTIHKDDNVIIEAIFSDLWWLAPEEMSITLSTGATYNNISYFRVYRPIPWNTGYCQVFVLYQDGNARLLPVPPEGVDWIPFGSSVIIGHSNPTVVRPYASIKHVHIDLENIILQLSYFDGSSAKLKVVSSMSETRVYVSDLHFTRSSMAFPFATLRSMYVAEGNTDSDHVSINGQLSRHIMENFGAVAGRNFVFYRKCMSRHLNLSPDIFIDVRRTGNDVAKVHLLRQYEFQVLLERIQSNRIRLWTPRV